VVYRSLISQPPEIGRSEGQIADPAEPGDSGDSAEPGESGDPTPDADRDDPPAEGA
jgi:hypothetical protein